MKLRSHAKIGTHSSTSIVLWDFKDINKGDRIFAMEADRYNSLHSSRKNIKSNGCWDEYIVDDIHPILFLSKIWAIKL